MALIRWASLISVEEEAADAIGMWFFSLMVASPSRDGTTVGPTYLSDVRGLRSKIMQDVLKITKLRGRPRRQHKVGNSYQEEAKE